MIWTEDDGRLRVASSRVEGKIEPREAERLKMSDWDTFPNVLELFGRNFHIPISNFGPGVFVQHLCYFLAPH